MTPILGRRSGANPAYPLNGTNQPLVSHCVGFLCTFGCGSSQSNTSNGPAFGAILESYEYRTSQIVGGTPVTPFWTPLRAPGQYHDEETDWDQNWNRFYDTVSGRYLEPEPMWETPAAALESAQEGMQWPVYGYAANIPVGFFDSDGFVVRNVNNSDRIDLALAQCMAAPGCASALEYLQASPIEFRLLDTRLERSPGDESPAQTGGEGHECGSGKSGWVDIRLDFDQVEANERDRLRGFPPLDQFGNADLTPSTHVGTLAHEFFHEEQYVPGTAWGSGNSAQEERAANYIDVWVQRQLYGRGITPY